MANELRVIDVIVVPLVRPALKRFKYTLFENHFGSTANLLFLLIKNYCAEFLTVVDYVVCYGYRSIELCRLQKFEILTIWLR